MMNTKESQDACSLLSTLDDIETRRPHTSSNSKGNKGSGVARESAAVNILKRYIIGMFALGALIASTTTWRFASSQEQHDFSKAFDDHASRLLEAIHNKLGNRIADAAELSTTISSFIKKNPATATASPESKDNSCAIPLYMAPRSWISVASTGTIFSPMVYAMAQDEESTLCSNRRKGGESNDDYADNSTNNNDSNAASEGRILGDRTWCKSLAGSAVGEESDCQSPYTPPYWHSSTLPNHDQWVICIVSNADICQRTTEVMKRIGGVLLSDLQVQEQHKLSPKSHFFTPVNKHASPSDRTLPSITFKIDWQSLLTDSLNRGRYGKVTIVVGNSCGQVHSFESNEDNEVQHLGEGDLHNIRFNHLGRTRSRSHIDYWHDALPIANANIRDYKVGDTRNARGRHFDRQPLQQLNFTTKCEYDVSVYPTAKFERDFITAKPICYTFFVILLFALTIKTFLEYDSIVEKRQANVLRKAVAAEAIVNSLFPHNVRDRVFQNAKQPQPSTKKVSRSDDRRNSKNQRLKRIMLAGIAPKARNRKAGQPIADLFPNTTVMFADIAGFTAWSSEREPDQVFLLLEALYQNFDSIAHRLGVFKVETIGDCYVAVTGLPDSNPQHALIMARFAMECLRTMDVLIKKMEVTLGPGTADLGMKFGLHSGPVIAGVLRGEKSRFQLFGDTMNTASRMESTSRAGSIQVSQETADLIIAGGKQHWLIEREGMVYAKGKGEMKTYWLKIHRGPPQNRRSLIEPETQSTNGRITIPLPSKLWGQTSMTESNFDESTNCDSCLDEEGDGMYSRDEKVDRLIDWNVEVLVGLLEKVMSRRFEMHGRTLSSRSKPNLGDSCNILDEVNEIVALPPFDPKAAMRSGECTIKLPNEVKFQLRVFVTTIASLYQRGNAFHNFDHASHVLMSANKLMKRIVSHDDIDSNNIMDREAKSKCVEEHHKSTFGISSDPLAQFAIVFSALIHDVEHTGVPNSRRMHEEPEMALKYCSKSVAEQNSVVVAWDILMQEQFVDLQRCIFSNDDDRHRFRQLVVNSVMATDIMDRDLQDLRTRRWAKAFQTVKSSSSTTEEDINRKATIVIEHIIQASDVAHTMQHWHIFTRWNARLFNEMYTAYLQGRSDKDPSEDWYDGEIVFFDFYVIPLAKKLAECGVFGVSSHEYLQYAIENRREWEMKGKDVVKQMKVDFLATNSDLIALRSDLKD